MMPQKITRREFLKIAAATSAVAIPAAGYGFLRFSDGDYPEAGTPYMVENSNEVQTNGSVERVPILVLYHEDRVNPFGKYLGEILLAEGLNSFNITSVEKSSPTTLELFDIVLLGEGHLNQEQINMLEGFVWNGGRLIAMRPNGSLSNLFGIQIEDQEIEEGYIQVRTDNPITTGIERQSMQFHGKGNLYQLVGADALAWLSPEAEVEPIFPAVTLNRYGAGYAVAWAYDLAKSVVYMRQGNPDLAGVYNDAWDGMRAINMYVDWIDLERIHIPQADEQQHFLTKIITWILADIAPLPRIYYLPAGAESLFVVTGDSHGNPGSAIEKTLSHIEQYDAHMSIYYTSFPNSRIRRSVKKLGMLLRDIPKLDSFLERYFVSPTDSQISDWRGRGHEISFHPYVEDGLKAGWDEYWNEFTSLGYGPISRTVRTHRIQWDGWVETARVQASYGIKLNLDYYHWGPIFRKKDGQWVFGHFTGSGLPMRFCDENGNILNIFQQLTQIADDHMLNLHFGGIAKLDAGEAVAIANSLIQQSSENFPAVFVSQFHVDPYAVGGDSESQAHQFLDGISGFVASKNIPRISAEELLEFTETREQIRISNIEMHSDGGVLLFDVDTPGDLEVKFELLLPGAENLRIRNISIQNQSIKYTTRKIKGTAYYSVVLPAGHQRIKVEY